MTGTLLRKMPGAILASLILMGIIVGTSNPALADKRVAMVIGNFGVRCFFMTFLLLSIPISVMQASCKRKTPLGL